MARISDVRRPAMINIQDGMIYANREQNSHTFLPFPRKCSFNLVLNPVAANGIDRQHDQELIVRLDGLIDAQPRSVADLQVLGCEPATDSVALQIRMETLCKLEVSVRIADETRMELVAGTR